MVYIDIRKTCPECLDNYMQYGNRQASDVNTK